MEPIIFFSSPPVMEDLCALTICVKSPNQQSRVSQPHILRCRELLFTEGDIIASPSADSDYCFNIIMQKSLFRTGRLQARLQKLGLEHSKPFSVYSSLYQSCLHYTIMAKLAPSWNKTGEWYIQGRDFAVQHGYTKAIKMNLHVNNNEIFASICGTIVRFPPLQCRFHSYLLSEADEFVSQRSYELPPLVVEDLNLSHEEMLKVVKSTQEDGRDVELHDSWCHVLPSLKRGKVLAVSLMIPSESPFSSYTDLKRYWKNMYGYRLPESDEDILYCQVSFSTSRNDKQFTYPNICLRNRPMQFINRMDPKPIVAAFLQDIHTRIGHVCAHPLQFLPKMHFAQVSLHSANVNEEKTLSNLTNSSALSGKFSSKHISQLSEKYVENKSPSFRSIIKSVDASYDLPKHGQQIGTQNKQCNNITDKSDHCRLNQNQRPTLHNLHSDAERNCFSGCKNQLGKPFKEGSTLHDNTQSPLKKNKCNVDSFRTKLTSTESTESTSTHYDPNRTSSIQSQQKPINSKALETKAYNKANTSLFVPVFQSKLNRSTNSQKKYVFNNKCTQLEVDSNPPLCNSHQPTTSLVSKQSCGSQEGKINGFDLGASKMVQMSCDQRSKSDNLNAKKRIANVNESEAGTVKKPKCPPKVQKNLDIESLASVNQLSKVNAASLMTWLKERGIKCTSKDKKSNLMSKAYSYLNISVPES